MSVTHVCAHAYTCAYTRLCTYTHVHTHVRAHVCAFLHISYGILAMAHVCTFFHVHIHAHVYIHARAHACTHVCAQARAHFTHGSTHTPTLRCTSLSLRRSISRGSSVLPARCWSPFLTLLMPPEHADGERRRAVSSCRHLEKRSRPDPSDANPSGPIRPLGVRRQHAPKSR